MSLLHQLKSCDIIFILTLLFNLQEVNSYQALGEVQKPTSKQRKAIMSTLTRFWYKAWGNASSYGISMGQQWHHHARHQTTELRVNK